VVETDHARRMSDTAGDILISESVRTGVIARYQEVCSCPVANGCPPRTEYIVPGRC
jgi:hypothetical protein